MSGSSRSGEEYYLRQTVLAEVGIKGQERLCAARILVVGAGGLGCPVATYLAAAGVGTVTVIDGDTVSVANLHRQTAFRPEDAGQPKATLLAESLSGRAPGSTVCAIARAFGPADAELVEEHDLVVECTDTFSAQAVVHDTSFRVGRDLVIGSIRKFAGTVTRYDFSRVRHGCLRCVWPETPEDGATGSSAQDGILGTTPGVIGAWMAQEAILRIVGSSRLEHAEQLLIDTRGGSVTRISPARDPRCPLCGTHGPDR